MENKNKHEAKKIAKEKKSCFPIYQNTGKD